MRDNRSTCGEPSSANIRGHPIHPMIVQFPITLLVGAFVSDLVYLITGNTFWPIFSYWLILVGLLTGVAAGIAGATDFLTIGTPREHVAGWVHAGGNILVIILTFINLMLRWENPVLTGTTLASGFILSLIVAATLVITGWYGGELSYRYMVGVVGPRGQTISPQEEERRRQT